MNEWINDKAVYRTAPATPGLLKIKGTKFTLTHILDVSAPTHVLKFFFPISDIATYRLNLPRGQFIWNA